MDEEELEPLSREEADQLLRSLTDASSPHHLQASQDEMIMLLRAYGQKACRLAMLQADPNAFPEEN